MSALVRPNTTSHWYSKTGEPMHEIEMKTKPGQFRSVDIRDAKKIGLLPSVTNILNIIAKPALNAWMQENAITSALTLPRNAGESDQDFAKRVVKDMETVASNAANLGTEIHTAIERHLRCEFSDPKYEKVLSQIDRIMAEKGWKIAVLEQVLVSTLGFAGRVDAIFTDDFGRTFIVDFKTQKWRNDKPTFYEEWSWQLAGYSMAYGGTNMLCSICIDTSEIGRVEYKIYEAEESRISGLKFLSVLRTWQNLKEYFPGKATSGEQAA